MAKNKNDGKIFLLQLFSGILISIAFYISFSSGKNKNKGKKNNNLDNIPNMKNIILE